MVCQEYGRVPGYLARMREEVEEEARRWEEEQEAERAKREAMKLSDEERENILTVIMIVLL